MFMSHQSFGKGIKQMKGNAFLRLAALSFISIIFVVKSAVATIQVEGSGASFPNQRE